MEAASLGGSLPVPSSQIPPRNEWRHVPEHSFHNNGGDELEHVKFGQSDERTIYEEMTGPLEVDFRSITSVDGELSDETLQGRLQEVSRQREELEHLETELRAQAIARTEIMEMQRRYKSQIGEHVDAAAQLKDRLMQREQQISELKVTLEEKERELRSVKIDNEAVWAKEDLLREQNKELATFRRELDNSESERAQHLTQIHDLQELLREKESQFLALEEQHRVARETILYKDEQLREAQAWIARVQMDALQSTTNQSLQAELRERTEHFNQYWVALHRQFAEMERHHIQTIQQLHLELAEARGRSEIYKDGSRTTHENSTDSSSHLQKMVYQMGTTNGGILNNALTHPSNGNFSTSSSSINTEHASGVPIFSPLLGMGTFLPTGQMAAFRPFIMHPQGAPQSPSSTNSMISQSYLSNVLPASSVPNQQYWPNLQATPNQNKCNTSQLDPNQVGSGSHFSSELSADGKLPLSYHRNSQNNQQQISFLAINGSNKEIQVPEISSKQHLVSHEIQETSTVNSHLNAAFRCETTGQESEQKDHSIATCIESQELVVTASNQQCLTAIIEANTAPNKVVGSNSSAEYNRAILVSSEITIPITPESSLVTTTKAMDHTILDERALLACIVRAIPAGSDGRIRISSTLPNRLGKMLAPLHWHDYKKHYGKLDDFVCHHPELFVIEGDFIHLREGAQEIISATAAVAKVAAAAASSVPYSSLVSSVAVTPVSQGNRHKKASVESKSVNSVLYLNAAAIKKTQDSYDRQPQNSIGFNIVQEISDVNQTKNSYEMNGLATEMNTTRPTASNVVGNGSNRGSTNVGHVFAGKQQGRSSGTGVVSRR